MPSVASQARRFLTREDGPTTVEYAVILALILGALIAVISALGGTTARWWDLDSSRIISATDAARGG
jgi:Flp pilus assembly pilin Flp